MGNFTVFPGSQDVLAANMAAHGEQWLFTDAAKQALDMAPVQVTCDAGDVILAHPLLAHRVAVNYRCGTPPSFASSTPTTGSWSHWCAATSG